VEFTNKGLHGFPNAFLDLFWGGICIDDMPSRTVRFPKFVKHLSHAILQLFFLITLVAIAAPRFGDFRRYVKEEDEIGSGQTDIGRPAPFVGETFRSTESTAGKGVSIADDGDTGVEV